MNQHLVSLLQLYTNEEILQICKSLNKNYNIYDPESVRWRQIEYVLNKTPKSEIKQLRNNCLSNGIVNDLIFNYYFCERVIKYHFIKNLRSKMNHIVAFEMTIGDSRVDICRINGCSYAYEIKTEYDTFDRLHSQIRDYTKTFEKVYVIVPRKRVNSIRQIIPESCGIISYRISSDNIIFSYARKAQKNNCNIIFCIENLSSNDMSYLLKQLGEKSCQSKVQKRDKLVDISNKKPIWAQYRKLLKNKYEKRWGFLTDHFDEILPIDIQSFFSSKIDPNLLYKK